MCESGIRSAPPTRSPNKSLVRPTASLPDSHLKPQGGVALARGLHREVRADRALALVVHDRRNAERAALRAVIREGLMREHIYRHCQLSLPPPFTIHSRGSGR